MKGIHRDHKGSLLKSYWALQKELLPWLIGMTSSQKAQQIYIQAASMCPKYWAVVKGFIYITTMAIYSK